MRKSFQLTVEGQCYNVVFSPHSYANSCRKCGKPAKGSASVDFPGNIGISLACCGSDECFSINGIGQEVKSYIPGAAEESAMRVTGKSVRASM